jgi:hypothetical protein
MKPKTAKKALLATHGGLNLERCAVLFNISPMAVYCLLCSFGRTCLVTLLTRCYLPLPDYFIVDEKHSHCLEERIYLPTIVCGRVIWHSSCRHIHSGGSHTNLRSTPADMSTRQNLSYSTAKSVEAFCDAYGKFRQADYDYDPSYCVKGILTDGFASTRKSLKQLFPTARLANCFLHAIIKFPTQIKWVTKTVRRTLTLKLWKVRASSILGFCHIRFHKNVQDVG